MATASDSNNLSLSWTLTVTETSHSQTDNSSVVTATLTCRDSQGVSFNSDTKMTGSITVNGTTTPFSFLWSSAGTSTRTLKSFTQTIDHASNGTKTASFSFSSTGIPGTANSGGGSDSGSITLTAEAPFAPAGLTVNTPGVPTSLGVRWSAPSSGSTPASYDVQIDNNPAYSSPTTVNTSATSYTFTGLTPGTQYWWRARSKNVSGMSSFGSSVTATTLSGGKRWDGTAWVPAIGKRWDGTAWVTLTITKRFDGTNWVNLT